MYTRVQLIQDFLHYLVCFTIGMVLYSDSYGTSMFYKQLHRKIIKNKRGFDKRGQIHMYLEKKYVDIIVPNFL